MEAGDPWKGFISSARPLALPRSRIIKANQSWSGIPREHNRSASWCKVPHCRRCCRAGSFSLRAQDSSRQSLGSKADSWERQSNHIRKNLGAGSDLQKSFNFPFPVLRLEQLSTPLFFIITILFLLFSLLLLLLLLFFLLLSLLF